MPEFELAWRTRPGTGAPYRDIVLQASFPNPPDVQWVVLALDFNTASSPPPLISLEALIHELEPFLLKACLRIEMDTSSLTLKPEAVMAGIWHYFRLADATLKPLTNQPGPLAFAPGDAYIALSPGARRIADSPAVAGFLHMRDDFDAEKLADALLDRLAEMAGLDELPEDITALVIEAR